MRWAFLFAFILILILLILVGLCDVGNATTWYVKSDASGANDGTSWTDAWEHLDFTSSITAGDTVFINGTFKQQGIDPIQGGGAGTHTFYVSGNGTDDTWTRGDANIWGGDTLTGWSDQGGGVYRASSSHITLAVQGVSGGSVSVDDTLILSNEGTTTTPGSMEFGESGGFIYVQVEGGTDPTGLIMGAWGDTTILNYPVSGGDFDGWHTYYGLKFKYARSLVEIRGTRNTDSVLFERCDMRCFSGGIENVAIFMIKAAETTDTAKFPFHWRVRACTLAYVAEQHADGISGHGYGLHIYSHMRWTIDSNYFRGYFGERGQSNAAPISFKGQGSIANDNVKYGTVVAFNNIHPKIASEGRGASRGITMWNGQREFRIYGNLIRDCDRAFEYTREGTPSDGPIQNDNHWYNNTVIDCGRSSSSSVVDGRVSGDKNFVKYNVFAFVDTFSMMTEPEDTVYMMDSNLYYSVTAPGSPFNYWDKGGPNIWYTIAEWKSTYGWEDNSSFGVDPGFSDTTDHTEAGYARPSASGEMNFYHNGKTWTDFGAVQNEAGGGQPTGNMSRSRKSLIRILGGSQ